MMEDQSNSKVDDRNGYWLGRISTLAFIVVCFSASLVGAFLGLVATALLFIFGVDDNQRLGAATIVFTFIGLMLFPAWLVVARSRLKPTQPAPIQRPRVMQRQRPAQLMQPVREPAVNKNVPSYALTSDAEIGAPLMQVPLQERPANRPISRRTHYRVIDWVRAFNLAGAVPIVVLFGLYMLRQVLGAALPVVAVLCIVVYSTVLFTHFRGTVIDTVEDSLSFPTLFLPRRVKLSEIHDANSEFWSRSIPGGNFGDLSVKERDGVQRIYAANLSGDFGGRQIKFWSKKRRDHFLSHLRDAAPHVRITMWR